MIDPQPNSDTVDDIAEGGAPTDAELDRNVTIRVVPVAEWSQRQRDLAETMAADYRAARAARRLPH